MEGIAEKIGRFIHSYKRVGNLETHRLVDMIRGATDKAVQPRAIAETRGENFRTPNVDLDLRVSNNKSLNADLGFRVSGSKNLNATLGQLGQFIPNSSGKNKEVAHDGHMSLNEGLNEIKILVSQFLEALSHWSPHRSFHKAKILL
ncbi:hypothetical protein RDI58_010673 [Solanum bulbocastanum]|uniref:Uncharacterized protein n=1 Tax=Solanum bulbocastanum TaxID=147425 RepID=A0AAN8YGK6_SOLBU